MLKQSLFLSFMLMCLGINIAGAEGLQIAPFYGLRFGGNMQNTQSGDSLHADASAAMGATLSIPIGDRPESVEFLYSRQDTELSGVGLDNNIQMKVEEYQAGILREYPYDQWHPFLVGTLGVSHFEYSDDIKDHDLFSVGMGGGVKYFPTPHIGFRLDLKAYVSFVEGAGAVACNGGCVIQYQGSTFLQGEITPSVIIYF